MDDTIINLIVVETESEIFEYFLKYIFTGTKYYLEDGSIDMSRFNGNIETYDALGNLTGTTTIENGNVINVTGDTNPCPDEDDGTTNDEPDNNDDTNNDNTGSGGVPNDDENPGDGDPSGGNGGGLDGGGGWFDGGPDWSFCTFENVYLQLCQNQIDHPDLFPNPQPHEADQCQVQTGAYYVYVWDCNPITLGGRTTDLGNDNPCDGFTGVLLGPPSHRDLCSELKKLGENIKSKEAIEDMEDKADDVSITREYGYLFSETADPVEAQLIEGSNGLELDIPTGGTIYGHGHTHPYKDEIGEKVYPMFSYQDIIRLQDILQKYEGQITQDFVNKAFSIMPVQQGTGPINYVLKLENYNTFINYFTTQFSGLTQAEVDEKVREKTRRLKNKYKRLWKRFTTNDSEKYLAALFKFIESEGLSGLSIYRNTDDTLLNWERMDYNPNNTSAPISTTPCNN